MRGVLVKDAVEHTTYFDGRFMGMMPWDLNARIEFPDEGITHDDYTLCAPQFMRETTFKDLEELHARGIDVDRVSAAGDLYDFGYAMTVHKSQGSQYNHVVWYLDRPIKSWDDDWKRFAYTAATRASERLTILL
jgi:hypothetical protein